ASGTSREFLFLIDKSGDYHLDFSQISGGSTVRTVVVILCADAQIKVSIKNYINGQNETNTTHILNFVKNGTVDIVSELEIDGQGVGSTGELHIENIFLGDEGKITGVPRLNIWTDKAKANHSLKATRIKNEDMFYLSSRGLGEDDAKYILLQGKIRALLDSFDRIDVTVGEEVMEKFWGYMKKVSI
ncbi:MAG: SufD family Fe-S cluster assembly protein, partial [Candidatus Gracilibacteria bacterium]|nr:SufD family Fe-S cluster assembly protein [Candidatus Gracilibacteria bacterium]